MAKRKAKTLAEETSSDCQPKQRNTATEADYYPNPPQMSPTLQSANRLCSDFFETKSCIELSKALLGKILCRKLDDNGHVLRGRIVETEAYLGGEDKGSNTYGGRRTEANEPMYMRAGTCFVYMTYGMYHCFNVTAHQEGAGVLLRAIEPLEGMDQMQALRARSRKVETQKLFKVKDLTNGPSKLCMAFGINKNDINKVNVTDSPYIWLEGSDSVPEEDIVSSKRIGITRADEWNDKPLRFYIRDSQFISQS